ncbi:MAG: peroxide stress protein YaaA [Flavobacteriales bacterium]|nr:peroxide stress protein YaaA [Crocinitomicaceae bacterium]NBX78937.1 peroxide stress protein YaaA [Flavobacteriales bacterium]NCA20219.1 peroxide stress protein YaaA [Crocinitomicaceae bacterium]
MKILLSPAKSINENALNISDSTIPVFQKESSKIVNRIKKLKSKDLQELMSVSKDIADLNVTRFKNWKKSDSEDEKLIQAGSAFIGEVYRGIDIASLSNNEITKANEQIRILSGLYGVLKPSDLIYPYRLEMGTRFSPLEEQTNLYQFWNDKVAKAITNELSKGEIIVNLASHEYFKVIGQTKMKNRIITPTFKEFKNGKFSIVMMYAKHARGAMARYLIQNELNDINELKLYNVDGYTYDENQSSENEWVFVR